MHSTRIYIPRGLITLVFPTFTFNFLLSHTQPKSLTSLHNFSATLMLYHLQMTAGLSQTCHHSLPAVPAVSSCTLAFNSHSTLSIYTLNNHGDITQSRLNSILFGNQPLTSIPNRTYALIYLHKNSALLSTTFLPTPYNLTNCHIPCRSIVSYEYWKIYII